MSWRCTDRLGAQLGGGRGHGAARGVGWLVEEIGHQETASSFGRVPGKNRWVSGLLVVSL